MNKFDPAKGKLKAEAIIEAEAALTRYLHECFPTGARCGVILMHGQKNTTPATIIGVSPTRYGGEITVEIDTAKPRSRRRYRRIRAADVHDVRSPAAKSAGGQE